MNPNSIEGGGNLHHGSLKAKLLNKKHVDATLKYLYNSNFSLY